MAAIEPEITFTNKAILTDQLPDYRNVTLETVSKRLLRKILVELAFFLVIVLVAAIFLYAMAWVEILYVSLGFLGMVIFSSLVFFYHKKAQKNYAYAIREKDILFQKGVLVIKTTIIPFNRVQHVSTTQSLLDKYFTIKNVKIFTAGGQGSDIKIPGLSPEKAHQIKEWIAHKIVEEKIDE